MQLGLGVLRLSPAEFWRATPREIAAAVPAPEAGLTRLRFDQLVNEFPDVL